MKCTICHLLHDKKIEAEYILNGFSVCEDHYLDWESGEMEFKFDSRGGMPIYEEQK